MNAPEPAPRNAPLPSDSSVAGHRLVDAQPPVVPDYELIRRIGGGAYGDVWLARSKATGKLRAAKIVWRRTFDNDRPFQREFEGIQRFERLSREHPSQLALFHIGRNESEGYFYYVMELADDLNATSTLTRPSDTLSHPMGEGRGEGGPPPSSILDPLQYSPRTLRADLAQGRLPAARGLEIGLALTEALSHLHRHGLVHRDVKPSNVIFVNGRPKLADIGLVTDASDQCSIVGTEGYLPPEGPGTPQADIFALGKVLYEAATGMDRREFPKLPDDLRSSADTKLVFELNEIVLKACAGNTRERYVSAQRMQTDLARLAGGKSILQAHRAARRWRLARRGAAWLTAPAIAASLLLLTLYRWYPTWHPYVGKPSKNDAANQSYKLGRMHFDKLSGTEMTNAAKCFKDATRADPQFALAHGYLALTYSWCSGDGWNSWNPYWTYLPQAKEEARKAQNLDDGLAEPHLALGVYHMLREWAWGKAEKEYRLAIKSNPGSPFCHLCYAEFLRVAGRTREALREINYAKRLDEHSFIINYRLASYLVDFREFQKALDQVKVLRIMDPTRDVSYVEISALTAMGQYREAIDSERKSRVAAGKSEEWIKENVDPVTAAVGLGGAKAYWSAKLKLREEAHDIYGQACCYAQLHDTNAAMNILTEAASRTNTMLTFRVMTDWKLDPVRSDPRFRDILKTMHLQ